MARAGTLLPLLPSDVETLSPYSKRARIGLDDRRDDLQLLALPRRTSRASFNTGGLLRSNEIRSGGWRLQVESPRRIELTLQASLRTLHRPFVPGRVQVDGQLLRGWSYERRTGVLRLRTPVRDGVIRVLPRPGGRGHR